MNELFSSHKTLQSGMCRSSVNRPIRCASIQNRFWRVCFNIATFICSPILYSCCLFRLTTNYYFWRWQIKKYSSIWDYLAKRSKVWWSRFLIIKLNKVILYKENVCYFLFLISFSILEKMFLLLPWRQWKIWADHRAKRHIELVKFTEPLRRGI
jgi:hypothetical protein